MVQGNVYPSLARSVARRQTVCSRSSACDEQSVAGEVRQGRGCWPRGPRGRQRRGHDAAMVVADDRQADFHAAPHRGISRHDHEPPDSSSRAAGRVSALEQCSGARVVRSVSGRASVRLVQPIQQRLHVNKSLFRSSAMAIAVIGVSAVHAQAQRGPADPQMRGDGPPPEAKPFSITKADPALNQIISPDAKLVELAHGFGLTEAGLWMADGQSGSWIFGGLLDNVLYR